MNNYGDIIKTTDITKRLQSGLQFKKIDYLDKKAEIIDGSIIIKQQSLMISKDRIINS